MGKLVRALVSDLREFPQSSGAILSDTKFVRQAACPSEPGGFTLFARKLVTSCVVAVAVLALQFGTGPLAGAIQDDGSGKSAGKGSNGSDESKQEGDSTEKETREKAKRVGEKLDASRLEEMVLPFGLMLQAKRGERSQRKAPKMIAELNPLPGGDQAIKTEDKRRFDEIRKPGQDMKPDDKPFLEDFVKRQVYSMTAVALKDWPNSPARKNRDDIEQLLNTIAANPKNVNEKFLAAYKQFLFQYLQDLLQNSLHARMNAMYLLQQLRDENTIGLFCDQISDPDQHEAVKFLAIEGLEQIGRRKITRVDSESRAVATLLNVLEQKEYTQKTRMAAVRALGSIGRPGRDIGLKRDVNVAVTLLKIMRDPNIRRWDRHEAMNALASLSIPPEIDYNFQVVAYEIGQFAAETGQAAVKDPLSDDLYTHLFLVAASNALTTEPKQQHLAAQAKKHGGKDELYVRMLGDPVKELAISALKIFPGIRRLDDIAQKMQKVKEGIENPVNRYVARVESLREVLKSNPPRSLKLTPDTDELGPPPALVGPKIPAKDEKGADGPKEKAGPDTAENGRAGS
jgi:hypothetical protein